MDGFPNIEDDFYDDPDRLCPAACLYSNGFHEEARRFRNRFGGTTIYIPKRPQPSDQVAAVVGMEAAKLLAEELGGCRYDISRGGLHPKNISKLHIGLLSLARVQAGRIAVLLNVNERYVYRVRRLMRERGVQMPQRQGGKGRSNSSARKVQ